jgi:hypothetical protein
MTYRNFRQRSDKIKDYWNGGASDERHTIWPYWVIGIAMVAIVGIVAIVTIGIWGA